MLIVNALIEKQHFAESAHSLLANVRSVCLFVCTLEAERKGVRNKGRNESKLKDFICAYISKMYFGSYKDLEEFAFAP